jgi:RNA polymerase sigma-70 factor (ECF subfamily)
LLYAGHKDALYRYLLRGCLRPDVAAELAQDVWTKVIEARGRYTATARFTTWLYRIARNHLIDYLRAARPAHEALAEGEEAYSMAVDTVGAAGAGPDRQHEGEDCVQRLQRALEALPPAQRELVVLRYEGRDSTADWTLEELAELQGVPLETAKSRLRYAYARLKEVLGDCLEG